MQPLSGGASKSILILSDRSTQAGQQPVNSESFWRKKAEDVAADEVFFHKYFNQIGKGKQASEKKKEKAKNTEGSEDGENENEDEIWQALVDSRPEVEGPSDDDSDLEMLDLEDSDDGSEGDDGEVDVGVNEDDDEAAASDSDGGVVLTGFSEDEVLGSDDEIEPELEELFETESETAQPEAKTEETSSQKRKKLKSLPTFASVEDYAEMLENDEDEDEDL